MNKDHQDHEKEKVHTNNRHMIMMVLCCAIPMVAFVVVFALFPGSPYLGFMALVLCPLMMVFMHLPSLFDRKKKADEHT